jgi:hypothetical protein
MTSLDHIIDNLCYPQGEIEALGRFVSVPERERSRDWHYGTNSDRLIVKPAPRSKITLGEGFGK